ncbi:MAG: peptide ABC transporter substrate-binding protein [Candidatus Eremiobacteraeota bacterium]|nr:peptide ABC transporter substrate-binding protein [Candidatus Eremiobacteraeota bacterium]MBC5826853.1 peptide ABC transporter substrate-binding protein [Candidatus Eremiobacteraeota bacterium]
MAAIAAAGRCGVALGFLIAALSGCAKISTDGTAPPRGQNQWTVPGVLRVGSFEDLDNLNPLVSLQSFVGDVEEMIFSGLVQYDDHGSLVPDAAVAIPTRANGGISADGRTIIYHLRRNIYFSDGSPLTSADVEFTWSQIMNPRNNTPNRVPADEVLSMDTPDERTVVVHLRSPSAPFVGLFLHNGGTPNGAILPKHLLDRYGDLNRIPYNTHPIGSGPFVVTSWEPGSLLLLRANPRYWRGPPRLKEIDYRIIPNQNTLLTAVRSHEVDLYYSAPESQYATLVATHGYRVTKSPGQFLEHVRFNCARPLLRDVRVRRAIAYAIDWQRLVRDVYQNLDVAAMADQRPGSWANDPAVAPYPHDLARAQSLLSSAGWHRGSRGTLEKDGQPLRLTIISVAGATTREKAEQVMQQDLRAAGIDLEIRNYPANEVFATYAGNGILTRGRFDLALVALNVEPDPDDTINFGPDQLPPKGQNRSFYVDPEIGRWQAAARTAYERGERRKYYWMIQQRIHDALPIHGIVWTSTIDAVNADLKNFRPGAPVSDFWNAYAWSI